MSEIAVGAATLLQQDPLSPLPVEVQLQVLDLAGSRQTARASCQAFRSAEDRGCVGMSVLLPVAVADWPTAPQLRTLLARRAHLRSLSVRPAGGWCVTRRVADASSERAAGAEVMRAAATCSRLLQLHLCDSSAAHSWLADVGPVAACTALRTLTLQGCHSIADISPLAACTSLTSLWLLRCNGVVAIGLLVSCSQLVQLRADDCSQLADVSSLADCPSLTSVSLQNCPSVVDITALSGRGALAALRSLNLRRCPGLADIRLLAGSARLLSLELGCDKGEDDRVQISDLSPLSTCCALTELDLAGVCSRVMANISPLGALSALVTLNLKRAQSVTDISPLRACSWLRSLKLTQCDNIVDLQPLAGCRSLEFLDLQDCDSLVDISALAACPSLTWLHLCSHSVSDISALSACVQLTNLIMMNCMHLDDVTPLAACTQLQQLYLSNSFQLTHIGPLARCMSLAVLDVRGLPNLSDISALEACTALRFVALEDCHSVSEASLAAVCTWPTKLHSIIIRVTTCAGGLHQQLTHVAWFVSRCGHHPRMLSLWNPHGAS